MMSHITNFVPKMPIFSNLGRSLSSLMPCPSFSPSNPSVAPTTTPTHLNTFQNMFFEFATVK